MSPPIRILLQTTIPGIEDDWNIGRFSMLRDYLAELSLHARRRGRSAFLPQQETGAGRSAPRHR
ncbi:hypothetical protein [Sphingomonas sp. Root241]|uniref:hypothetical protein n=1 Tax=Sphingomonas sp. Root241 TaxID=1736501 RepID=UPI00190FCED2|nr:hypothetical protein [Sphingomonas sp. Root241]